MRTITEENFIDVIDKLLSVDKDIVGDLKVIIDKFIDTNKDMDNIVIVFEK